MISSFPSEILVRMGICYTVLYLTGSLVSRKAVKVNYTRKINHFTLLLTPFLLSFALRSNAISDVTNTATAAVRILAEITTLSEPQFSAIFLRPLCELLPELLLFVVLVEPLRKRVGFARTAFSAINRPEDEPYTLLWTASQAAVNYTAAAAVALYLSWAGRPELIFVIVVVAGIGDGFAEPIGVRFGKHKYEVKGLFVKRKYVRSYEGSACVFLTSLVAVLLFWSSFSSAQLALAVLAFPLVMTLAEAKAPHSWDNPAFFVIGGILFFLVFQFVV